MRRLTAVAASAIGTGTLLLAWNAGYRPNETHTAAAGPRPLPNPGRASTVAPPAAPQGPGPTASSVPPSSAHRQVVGPTLSTRYGPVQVQVDLAGATITDVVAVQLTNSNRTSEQISAAAAPILRQEALQAQSAHIDIVSGATYTSEGYQQSLQAALDAAHA